MKKGVRHKKGMRPKLEIYGISLFWNIQITGNSMTVITSHTVFASLGK